MKELEEAVISLKNKKAPRPVNISAEVDKLVFHRWPDIVFGAFNTRLKRRFLIDAGKWFALISIFGVNLWNVFYDNLYRFDQSEESRLVRYVERMAALVARRTVEQPHNLLDILMRRLSGRMTAYFFGLVLKKKPK